MGETYTDEIARLNVSISKLGSKLEEAQFQIRDQGVVFADQKARIAELEKQTKSPTELVDCLIASENRTAELEKKLASQNDDLFWLLCLENAGVDNWPGIDYAYELKEEGGE